MNSQLAQFIDSLQKLVDFKVRNMDDLDQWYEKSRDFEKEVTKMGDFGIKLPHFFWHYLFDGDIRFKDSEYANSQEALIHELIAKLKREDN